jgi:hypothetical protein
MSLSSTSQPASNPTPADWVSLVREKVQGLRYGIVQLTVHDGRVTQIERTEKTRLSPGREASTDTQN